MLPISPRDKIAFTPPHLWNEDSASPKPVIWLRPMTLVDRARWRAALSAVGSRAVSDAEMAALRGPILEKLETTPEEIAAIQALYELGEAARNEGRALDHEQQVQLMTVERMLVAADAHYRMMAETRNLYVEVAPLLALQQQCIGWQNLPHRTLKDAAGNPQPLPFRRVDGRVSDEALEGLDPLTLLLAGFRAIGIGNVSEPDAKKSEQPSS